MTDKPITAAELEDWQRKTDAIDGPWSVADDYRVLDVAGADLLECPTLREDGAECVGMADADFMATASTAMPRLLAAFRIAIK